MARQFNGQQLGSRPLDCLRFQVRIIGAANDAANTNEMHVFLSRQREPPDAKLQLCLDSVDIRRHKPDRVTDIGQPDSRDGALALATRLSVPEIRSGSLVGLISDVVGLVLPTAKTRVDLEGDDNKSPVDSFLQFR